MPLTPPAADSPQEPSRWLFGRRSDSAQMSQRDRNRAREAKWQRWRQKKKETKSAYMFAGAFPFYLS